MGISAREPMQSWTEEQDNLIINAIIKAKDNAISIKSALVSVYEEINTTEGMERTYKSITERYYKLKRDGVFNNFFKAIELSDSNVDLSNVFTEMKKIIRERDDYKLKYEDALNYKVQYEEIKKKLIKYEKESAAFMDLLRRR